MRQAFMKHLESLGYKTKTPSGHPSTVYAYAKAIDSVRDREHITQSTLDENINEIIKKYDCGGSEECFGNQSHKTVINALKRYRDFLSA